MYKPHNPLDTLFMRFLQEKILTLSFSQMVTNKVRTVGTPILIKLQAYFLIFIVEDNSTNE